MTREIFHDIGTIPFHGRLPTTFGARGMAERRRRRARGVGKRKKWWTMDGAGQSQAFALQHRRPLP